MSSQQTQQSQQKQWAAADFAKYYDVLAKLKADSDRITAERDAALVEKNTISVKLALIPQLEAQLGQLPQLQAQLAGALEANTKINQQLADSKEAYAQLYKKYVTLAGDHATSAANESQFQAKIDALIKQISSLEASNESMEDQLESAVSSCILTKQKLDSEVSSRSALEKKFATFRKQLLQQYTQFEQDFGNILDETDSESESESENDNESVSSEESCEISTTPVPSAPYNGSIYSVSLGNGWHQYDQRVCHMIESAIAAGKSTVSTSINNQAYTLDLVKLIQFNDHYGTQRKIRCDSKPVAPSPIATALPQSTPSPIATALPQSTPAFDASHFDMQNALSQMINTILTPVAPAVVPTATQVAPSSFAAFLAAVSPTPVVPTSTPFVGFVPSKVSYFDRGLWIDFDKKVSDDLIASYVAGSASFGVQFGSTQYNIDFGLMTQKNMTTGTVRRIRFDTEKVAMYSDNSFWFPYDKKSSDAIVNSLGATVSITVKNQQYTVDTIAMIQTNVTTGVQRAIKLA